MPDAIILSTEYSRKYFGTEDPIGKTLSLQLNGELRDFTVRGVMQPLPANSGFQFDMAISNVNNKTLLISN